MSVDFSQVTLATENPSTTAEEVASVLDNSPQLETQYDLHAMSSYLTFIKLRDEGLIPNGMRFQVCIPNPMAVIFMMVKKEYQAAIEPAYEAAIGRALRRIQDTIPARDLAIQWDVCPEISILEDVDFYHPGRPGVRAWFQPVKEGIIERLVRAARFVDPDVEIGYHLCYW